MTKKEAVTWLNRAGLSWEGALDVASAMLNGAGMIVLMPEDAGDEEALLTLHWRGYTEIELAMWLSPTGEAARRGMEPMLLARRAVDTRRLRLPLQRLAKEIAAILRDVVEQRLNPKAADAWLEQETKRLRRVAETMKRLHRALQ